VDEMDNNLIQNWNYVVKPNDEIYVVGDMFFGPIRNREAVENILKQLHGRITLILGNHDPIWIKKFGGEPPMPTYFYKTISINGQPIFMCHYPMVVWDRSHYGSWLLYGHSHEDRIPFHPANSMNVATDLHNYTPLSFDEVREKIERQQSLKGGTG